MPKTRDQIREERRKLKAEYHDLFNSVTALLFRNDPIGISFDENTDEYELEARTILPRLRSCVSFTDVLLVVHEEFTRWFGSDIAGQPDRYRQIATEIWDLWQAKQVKE